MPFNPYGRLGNGAPILVGARGPAGPPGDPGEPGPPGDYVSHFRGAYNAGTTYAAGDIVTSSGSSWIALAGATGVTPVEGATWTAVASAGTGQVNTVNTKPPVSGNVTLTASDVGAIPTAAAGAVNGVATLGADGVVPTSQIPALALVTAQPVASQAAMLALANVQPGDIAVRTDGAGTFILTAAPASTLANWLLLNAPTDKVISVNGQTGTVVLGAADVSALPATGTAAAATKLATARTIAGKSFDGTANVTLAPGDVGAASSTLGGAESVAALSATTGTATANCSAASVFTVTPTGNITLAFSNVPATGTSCTVTVIVAQGATVRTVTLPSGGVWLGSAPTQTASKACVITLLTTNGGTTWYASGVVQA